MDRAITAQGERPGEIEVSLVNEQSRHAVADEQLCEAVRLVLADTCFTSATISVAVVDDAAIHELNRRFLNHDWPTDVLSFALQQEEAHLEGEVVLSADTAASAAAETGWPAEAEQLLYVIHGALHLVGFRDKSPTEAARMRVAEAKYLRQMGFVPPCQNDGGRESVLPADEALRKGATAQ